MKRYLIITKELDPETNLVMRWMKFLESTDIIRLNGIDASRGIEVDYSEKQVFIDGQAMDGFDGVWYRKYPLYANSVTTDKRLNGQIALQQSNEVLALYRFINTFHVNENTLGSLDPVDNNKLENLAYAYHSGFKIPISKVLNSKEKLACFLEQYPEGVIAKPISNTIFVSIEEKSFGMFTEMIDKEILDQLPSTFQPTLFQEYIAKQYEVRVFYLKGEIYASAIFSDQRTDIRKARGAGANRIVPITLDKEIEEKIRTFMRIVNLDSGSLDLLIDSNEECFFLEVNPFGQFKEFSDACGYQLERKIAKKLLINGK